MPNWRVATRVSIGAKIFAAFAVMGLLTGALGGYGIFVLSRAGTIVADTYDRPLMAINYARSASLTFSHMDKELLRRRTAAPEAQAAIDAKLDTLTDSFFEDLNVALERSSTDEERAAIREITTLVTDWNAWRRRPGVDAATLEALTARIADRFDALIESTTGQSFVERRKAIWAISRYEYTSAGALGLALVLAAAMTALLTRRIILPLREAAKVAGNIAQGELETQIPAGGRDETGVLLRSMTVMQDNIRAMIEREAGLRRRAQTRLADALESSHEAMVLVDAGGKVVLANSQIAKFFPELAPELVEGAPFAAAIARAAESSPAAGEALASGGELKLPDGRWLRISRSSTQDGGFFLFLADFTDIKDREENYRQAKIEAEAASAAKSVFVANMSHELRTPLNSVIGYSEIICGEKFGKIEPRQYLDFAGEILASGKHLLDVINYVLDLTKSTTGKLQLHAEAVVVNQTLAFCAKMMVEQCAAAGLDFIVDWPEQPVVVQGEGSKLRQIFLNLLSNAVKFSEPGGKVTLTMTLPDDNTVEIAVGDTGIGMRPQDLPVALSPFGQIDSRLSRRYEGTGLGLPLTKAFVELHGGTMEIDSEVGRGTTVYVRLPRSREQSAGATRLAQAS
jgi:signal transduction histidine kinase